jgi:hypothetical protein
MAVNPDFKDLLLALSDARARFLIVGAHAVMHYTAPRYTKDLDDWVDPTPENAARVIAALMSFGAPLFDLEIADLARPGVTFQIEIEPNRIDILTEVENLDFGAAFDRCATTSYGGFRLACSRSKISSETKKPSVASKTSWTSRTFANPCVERRRPDYRRGPQPQSTRFAGISAPP